jgi:cell division protein FtsQ
VQRAAHVPRTGSSAGPPADTTTDVDRPWQPTRPSVVSARSAERFAERVRMRRTMTRRRLGWSTLGAAVAGALGWLLLVSPVLALDASDLQVRGAGAVVEVADVQEVVARYDGTPLPRLDTVGLRRAVLGVPGVRGAEVTRRWPHGLRIVLVAREPVAAVPLEGGVALVDREGVQVGRADAPPEDLPLVDVPLDDPDARALTAVLTVLEQLPDELLDDVATASARSRDTVAFRLADGRRVVWGSADQTALKARVLQTLRASEAAETARIFDVSAPTLPITRS